MIIYLFINSIILIVKVIKTVITKAFFIRSTLINIIYGLDRSGHKA